MDAHPSKKLWKSVWTQPFNSLLFSVGRAAICCILPCQPFVQDTEDFRCLQEYLQEIFPSRVSSTPILFVRSLLIRENRSQNQTRDWLSKSYSGRKTDVLPTLAVSCTPAWGTKWNKEGAEQHYCSPCAMVAQTARRNLRCLLPAFVKWSCSRWQIAWQIVWTHLQGHMSPSELYFQSIL